MESNSYFIGVEGGWIYDFNKRLHMQYVPGALFPLPLVPRYQVDAYIEPKVYRAGIGSKRACNICRWRNPKCRIRPSNSIEHVNYSSR